MRANEWGGRKAPVRARLFMGATLLLILGAPAALEAQSGQERELTREEMQARIHAQFERALSRDLGADAETRAEIQEILDSMREKRRALYERRRALADRKADFQETGGDEKEARRILSETRAIRAEEARIEAEEETRLLEIMSPAEVLKFQLLRDDFNERIRRMYRRGGAGSPEGQGDDSLLF